MRNARIILILIVAAVLAVSCAKKRVEVVPTPIKPYEGEVNISTLKQMAVFNRIDSLESELEAVIYKGDKKLGKFKGFLIFRKPDVLRMRFYDFFGMTAVDIVSSSGTSQIYIPSKNTIYEGSASLFRMPETTEYSMLSEEGLYVLNVYKTQEGIKELASSFEYDPVELNNTRISAFSKDRKLLSISFGDYDDSLPMRFSINTERGYSADIRLIDPEKDAEPNEDYFSQFGHSGMDVQPMEKLFQKAFKKKRIDELP